MKDNQMKYFLTNISIGVSGNTKIVTIKVLKNCTLSGMSFSNYDTNNSLLESSTTGTITNGIIINSIALAKDTSANQKFSDIVDDIFISPSESFSVVYSLSSGTSARDGNDYPAIQNSSYTELISNIKSEKKSIFW
eukprot:Lithocolla_globosa_v1_NODE_925_length_3076_cov_153.246938.p3 type:complete len:136 gc:universal NODE_925_length_3076_cov_153.246938:667-1074(+)